MKLKPRPYEQEMIGNFERKILALRTQLVNTTNQTQRGHIQSSIAILQVELAGWR